MPPPCMYVFLLSLAEKCSLKECRNANVFPGSFWNVIKRNAAKDFSNLDLKIWIPA